MKTESVALAFLGTLLFGLAAGYWLAAPAPDAPDQLASRVSGDTLVEDDSRVEKASLPLPPEGDGTTVNEELGVREAVPVEGPLFSERLRVYGSKGILEGWALHRSDAPSDETLDEGVEDYGVIIAESPIQIGMKLAIRETAREKAIADAAAGGAMALLANLDAGGVGPLPDLVANETAFSALFARQVSESIVDGLAHLKDPDAVIVDGVTFQLPAGVFQLSRLMKKSGDYPRDVTIAGAGMNSTLILMGDLGARGELHNFTVKDCTVFTDSDPILDLRSGSSTVQFQRARILGFDSGAGGSSLINTEGIAIWFRSCIIEGGYGRNPLNGRLFDVRTDALLARFDSCTIDQARIVPHMYPGATVLFQSCSLKNIIDVSTTELPKLPGVSFIGSFLTPYDEQTSPEVSKSLNELFPNWKNRIES
jgi:hypothetical protein